MASEMEFKVDNCLHVVGYSIMYQILKDFKPIDIIQLYNNPTLIDCKHEYNMRRILEGEPINGLFLKPEDCVPNNTQILYNVTTLLNDLIYNKIVPIIQDDPEYTQAPNMFISSLPFYVYYDEEKLNIYNLISYYEYVCSYNVDHAGSLTYGPIWYNENSAEYVQEILKMFYKIYMALLEKPAHNTIATNIVQTLMYAAHYNNKLKAYRLTPFEHITHHVQWGTKNNYVFTMNEYERHMQVLIVPDMPILKKYTIQDLKSKINFSGFCKPVYSGRSIFIDRHTNEFKNLKFYSLFELPKSFNKKIDQFLKATTLDNFEFLKYRKYK